MVGIFDGNVWEAELGMNRAANFTGGQGIGLVWIGANEPHRHGYFIHPFGKMTLRIVFVDL